MDGLRLPAVLRWGIVIGLALLALAAIGQFLRRRAWEEPLLDEPLMTSSFPEPRLAEPPPAPPAARPTFAPPATPTVEPASATETTAELEAVAVAAPEPPVAPESPATPETPAAAEPPAAPTGQADPVDGACPATHPIKGNVRTRNGHDERLYHAPDSPYYERTTAETCFATVEDARAAGFRAPREG
jgi:hypothetical protein